MNVLKNVLILVVFFFSLALTAQVTGEITDPIIGTKIGIDGIYNPAARFQAGTKLDRVIIDKNNRNIGAGYISFNNYFRNQYPSYPWQRMGTGGYNGGAIISATKRGDLQFFPVNTTGGSTAMLSDNDMAQRMVLKISHNNSNGGRGYVQINDGYQAVHIGEVSRTPFKGNGYVGFNVQQDEASNSWKTGGNGTSNGGNVIYSTMEGSLVVSALGSNGGGAGSWTDQEVRNNAVLKVDKDGVLNTREIEVCATTWCDYVFEEDYELRPLAEVRAFIKANKHLPEVPSEKEVLSDGINVGDMNVIFIKKIEELTLYILEQEEKIKALEAKIK